MKKENTVLENVEFLLMMYKREYKLIEEGKEERTMEEEEMIQCIIDELETIIELSK